MRSFSALLLLAALALPQPALAKAHHAAPKKKAAAKTIVEIPADKPEAVFDRDGKFAFCLLEHTYEDQRRLTMAFSPHGELNLGITIPKAGFKIGAKYDLTYTLDDSAAEKIRARALDENALLFQMGVNEKFLSSFSRANMLSLGGGGKVMSFELKPLHGAGKVLEDCAAANRGKVDEKIAKAEQALPEPLKALLVTSGRKNIVPLSQNGIPPEQRAADFLWKDGEHVLGGVIERAPPEGKTLTDLVSAHVKTLKQKCNGKFDANVGNEETYKGLTLRPADLSCSFTVEGKQRDVMVAVLFYITGAKRYTVFTHEAEAAYKADAITARDGIAKTLSDLAKAQ